MTEEKKYRSIAEIVQAKDLDALKKELPKFKPREDNDEAEEKYKKDLNMLLWLAGFNDDVEMINLIHKKGADINFEHNNTKPITNAVESFNFAAVEALAKLGANVNEQDGIGNSLIVRIVDNEDTKVETTPLNMPNPNQIFQNISNALSIGAAKPDEAAENKKKLIENINKMTDLLVSLGADISIPNLANKTALHFACFNNNNDIVLNLTKNDIDPTIESYSDSSVASEYLPEDNDELFEKMENYRESYAIRRRNPNAKKSVVKIM